MKDYIVCVVDFGFDCIVCKTIFLTASKSEGEERIQVQDYQIRFREQDRFIAKDR